MGRTDGRTLDRYIDLAPHTWRGSVNKVVQPVPKAVYRSGCRDKHNPTVGLDHGISLAHRSVC